MTSPELTRLVHRVDEQDATIRAIGDTVLDIKDTVDRHTETLDRHTETLDRHGEMLTEILRRLSTGNSG